MVDFALFVDMTSRHRLEALLIKRLANFARLSGISETALFASLPVSLGLLQQGPDGEGDACRNQCAGERNQEGQRQARTVRGQIRGRAWPCQ